MNSFHLLQAQKIISTRHFQSQFASVVKKARSEGNYYNVVRNSESVGVFIPKEMWDDLLEDMEALSSKRYFQDIQESREQHRKGQTVDLDDLLQA